MLTITTRPSSLHRRLLVTLALVACAPKPADTAGDTSTTGTASTTTGTTSNPGTGSASSTGPDPTTGGSTTGGPTGSATGTTTSDTTTSGTTSTGTTSTTGDDQPPSICDPQPEPVLGRFVIDNPHHRLGGIDYVMTCTVAAVKPLAMLEIELEGCKSDPDDPGEDPVTATVSLELSPTVTLDLAADEQVVLTEVRHDQIVPFYAFTLRRLSDELVAAGMSGPEMLGGPNAAPADMFAPFSLQVVEVCPPEPIQEPEPPATSSFIMEPLCDQIRRDSIRFELEAGATVDAIDHSDHDWPDQPYRVIVERAEHHIPIVVCSEASDNWYTLLLLRTQP